MVERIDLEHNDNRAFAEEEQNLANVENAISAEIMKEEATYNKYMEEVNDAYIVDWEDREKVQFYRMTAKKAQVRIQEYQSYVSSPYYARMDLSCDDGEVKTYLIGKQGLTIGIQPYVLDWRSEVGGTFANKHDTSFKIKEHEYKLFLRRAVGIQDAKVQTVVTEYDIDSVSLDGEIIDPFLISVLKDKRRNYKLSDIIRTIQANQNELIRKPLEESFIVQGCAGSGKTMILLHRLSYIAFHYSNANFERFCIITPNEQFNLHIDELSRELELSKIKRYTVDDFYISWIRWLGRNDVIISGNGHLTKQNLKIGPIDKNIISEKALNCNLLEEIYSEPTFYKLLNGLDEQWNLIFRQARNALEKVTDIVETDSQNFKSRFACFRNITNIISTKLTASQRGRLGLEKAKKSIEDAKSELDKASIGYNDLVETVTMRLNEAKNDIKNMSQMLLQKIEQQVQVKKSIQDRESEKEIKEKELSEQAELLSYITNHKTQLCSLDYLRDSSNPFAKSVLQFCSIQIQNVEKATASMKSVPFYNFGKRNKAKEELTTEQNKLTEQISDYIQKNTSKLNKQITLIKAELETLKEALVSLRQEMDDSDDASADEMYQLLNQCQNLMLTAVFPDLGNHLKPSDIRRLPQSINFYIESYKKYKEKERLIAGLSKGIEQRQAEIMNMQSTVRTQEEEESLESVLKLIDKLDFRAFDEYLANQLELIYKKYNQPYIRDCTYHHTLLYKLLLCNWYYSDGNTIGYHIYIDEAQDLSKTEYILLRNVMGKSTVFNLYGDVNQLIYDYKGITNWEDISEIISPGICCLNENYRNTIEITTYCNQKFDADVVGVGLHGAPVKETEILIAVQEMVIMKSKTPTMRIAIIYKSGREYIDRAIQSVVPSKAVNVNEQKQFSIITVEESKGLEFDAVLVVKNDMTANEEYISYTRALDNLYITEINETT